MNKRCEQRTVVDRNLVDSACLLGLRVSVGICAADKPENGGNVPLGSERPEILACWRWSSLPDTISWKMSAERIDNSRARLCVIHIQRIAVQCHYLRRSWSTGCRRLGVDDPFDGGEHAFAYAGVECTHVELDDCLVGDNVFLGAGL